MVKNTIKLYRFIFIKLTKNSERRNISYVRWYDVTSAEFKTLQLYDFRKSDQNATKLCTRLFIHKINKNMP